MGFASGFHAEVLLEKSNPSITCVVYGVGVERFAVEGFRGCGLGCRF